MQYLDHMSRVDKRMVGDHAISSAESPSERVLGAVTERRLMKLFCRRGADIIELYVFYGRDRSYIMIPRMFCSCKDFELNVISRGLRGACYHLASLELAKNRNMLRVHEVSCEALKAIALELLLGEDSLTLRKVAHSLTAGGQ